MEEHAKRYFCEPQDMISGIEKSDCSYKIWYCTNRQYFIKLLSKEPILTADTGVVTMKKEFSERYRLSYWAEEGKLTEDDAGVRI